MAGMTSRGYPYPHDSDPINVALDIELLAEAINADISAGLGQGSDQDQAQNVRLDSHQEQLNNLHGGHAAQAGQINTLNNNVAALQSTVNLHSQTLNEITQNQVVFGQQYGVTTDAFGNATILFPVDMFAGGSQPAVVIGDVWQGSPGFSLHGFVSGTSAAGFAAVFVAYGTTTGQADASFPVTYIAAGPGT